MARKLKKLKDESGVVLLITLVAIIVLMIFSVGILSQSLNQSSLAQHKVQQIQAAELAKGFFWQAYAQADATGAVQSQGAAQSVTVGSKTYTSQITTSISNGLNQYHSQVTY